MRPTTPALALLASVALLAAGCGGGGSGGGKVDRIGSMSDYDAAVTAKDILSKESVDPSSIAYGKVLMVRETVFDRLDGKPVFRVSFETLDGDLSNICIWVWLSHVQAFSEEVTYVIDRCPAGGAQAS